MTHTVPGCAPEGIAITKEEYATLLDAQRFLDCLRAAGVDNWEGYDYAIDAYNGEEDE
jgi:hypothetical protein